MVVMCVCTQGAERRTALWRLRARPSRVHPPFYAEKGCGEGGATTQGKCSGFVPRLSTLGQSHCGESGGGVRARAWDCSTVPHTC